MIITQSALEHFDDDLAYFKKVFQYVNDTKSPIIQIHLVPSAPCLYTFLFHGIRQYTPRTISKITRLFDDKTKKILYSLGGKNCNKVHRKYITYPILLGKIQKRYTETDKYNVDIKKAIAKDQISNNINNPNFYALVMFTNMSRSFNLF